MPIAFHPIPLSLLSGPVGYVRPRQVLPEQVTASSPAVDVMTDLGLTSAVTVSPAKPVDDALQIMVHKGVRMLLVEDLQCQVMGIITASDIQGEKPMLVSRESGVTHSEVLVRDIMVPIVEIEVMNFKDVSHSHVGDIVKTLTQAGRQHALVVEGVNGDQTMIRGIFSTSQISRQMGIPIEPSEKAQTFVELESAIAH
jgi:CBS domain containing-hemolysin-like protein